MPSWGGVGYAKLRVVTLILAAASLGGCTAPGPVAGSGSQAGQNGSGQIVLAVGGEPRTLVPSVGSEGAGPAEHLFEVVHQSLVSYDALGQPIARVARSLPSLSDGSWRLYPDGSMETVWRLREGVRWHDGRPLTTDDLVFSWRVFNSAAVPVVSRRAARLIEEIEPVDAHTVRMRWRGHYAFANQLSGFDLTLLPAHLLEASFELRPQQMAGHPYWQSYFVGLGPYRLARWIAGSSLELEPLRDYFLGPPGASHISVRFLPDDNAAMAAALGGSVDVVLPRRAALGIVQGVRQQWRGSGEGELVVIPTYSWVYLAPQFQSPQPEGLLDRRVRKALAFAVDRPAIAEAVAADIGLASDLWIHPTDRRREGITAGVMRYQYSPERTASSFREAGWRRESPDNVLVNRGERFELELTTIAEWHASAALVADYWRQAGAVVKENVLSLASVFDREARSSYPGVELAAAPPGRALLESRLRSTNAPSPENLWVGANRGHYASQDLDLLLDRIWQTIDPPQLEQVERDMVGLVAEELPIMGLYFYPAMALVRTNVRNVRPPETAPPVARSMFSWNAHEWRKQ